MKIHLFVPIWILFLMIFSLNAAAQNKFYQEYVEKYKFIAISEMHRTGIPASIKLAQALIESNAGRSELAQKANNHFGIKCGGDWNGNSFHKEDDDYDANGVLKKSCFRQFSSTEESFVAHSEFLRNPSKVNRYGFLFNLSTTDYVGWAEGLKKAGYATNPNYAKTLIRVVEEYKLHLLDEVVVPSDAPILASNHIDIQKQAKKYKYPERVVQNNSIPMVFARLGDTPGKIAQRTGVPIERILKANEEIGNANRLLEYGERVYLSLKRSTLRSNEIRWHYVQKGESMYNISQKYGIRLNKLLWKNHLKKNEEPSVGERISLKARIRRSDKPRLKEDIQNILPSEPTERGQDPDVLKQEVLTNKPMTSQSTREHVVSNGDTLFNISRRYGVDISEIKKLNSLESDQIRVGQLLRIP
jgi:LysM repeat protein